MIRWSLRVVELALIVAAAVVWTFASKSKLSWFTAGLLVVGLGSLSEFLRRLGFEQEAMIAAAAAIGSALIKGALVVFGASKDDVRSS